jgi:hypothetical protein
MKKILIFTLGVILLHNCQTSKKQEFDKNILQQQASSRVLISATQPFRGSGTLIGGYVLTNYHVVQKYDSCMNYLVFSNNDTTSFVVVVKDSVNDLALLRPKKYPADKMLNIDYLLKRKNKPRLGDTFFGVGFPLGQVKSIVSTFKGVKSVNVSTVGLEVNKKQVTLVKSYTLEKIDTLDYHGASGTLMFSGKSLGILTGTSNEIFVLINQDKIIEFLKKSGYF